VCVPEHVLLWVLDPYILSLGPKLNPREEKKNPIGFWRQFSQI